MTQRIAIVAGEASGDLLAARLIKSLQALNPELVFEGIAGQEMQQAGCHSLYPLEKLSVMGLVEVLKHLPELLRIRKFFLMVLHTIIKLGQQDFSWQDHAV